MMSRLFTLLAHRKWMGRFLTSKCYEHNDRASTWGTRSQSEARFHDAILQNRIQAWMHCGVWQEQNDQTQMGDV